MSKANERQATVDPWVQARRAELGARGQEMADALRDADLAAVGLPPTGLALIGGPDAGASLDSALDVATWLAGVIERAGLSEAARALYEARRDRYEPGARVFASRETAARELARRVIDHAAQMAERDNLEGTHER